MTLRQIFFRLNQGDYTVFIDLKPTELLALVLLTTLIVTVAGFAVFKITRKD